MGFPWDVLGTSTGLPWDSHRAPMELNRVPIGLPWGLHATRIYMGLHGVSMGTSMELPWFSDATK